MQTQKGFSQTALVAVVIGALVAAGIVWAAFSKNNSVEPEAMMEGEKMMDEQEEGMMESVGEEMMKDGSAMMDSQAGSGQEIRAGVYKDYSEETVAAEQSAGNKVVLFFHAPWCPFCKTADAAFRSRAADIPGKVAVLKTDYDSNSALKQKYGVSYQHTFVQIDSSGNQLSKWSGGDIENLKKYLK